MGRKPIGETAMTAAERQRRRRQKLGVGTASPFAKGLNADVKRKLARLALHSGCSVDALLREECPRLIERWATTTERQLAEQLKRKGGQAALKRYYEAR
jgi:hypothetical protein